MTFRHRLLIATSLGIAVVVACSDKTPSRHADVSLSMAPLNDALRDRADERIGRAVQNLSQGLNAAEWGYMLHATWPLNTPVDKLLADPILRKAMFSLRYAKKAPWQTVGVYPQDPTDEAHTSYDADLAGEFEAEALQAVNYVNGAPKLQTPDVVAAFALGLVDAIENSRDLLSPMPALGQAIDHDEYVCAYEFVNGNATNEQTCSKDFCCRGTLDWSTNRLECFDNTSCKGAGKAALLQAAGGTAPDAGTQDAGTVAPSGPCGVVGNWKLTCTWPATCGSCSSMGVSTESATIRTQDTTGGTVNLLGFSVNLKTCAMTASPYDPCPWTIDAKCRQNCPYSPPTPTFRSGASWQSVVICNFTCTECPKHCTIAPAP